MQVKILITGALGYIGSALIRNLGKDVAREIILLDNLESCRYASLFDLPKGVKVKFIKDDLASADINQYLSGVGIVIHLANTNYSGDAQNSLRQIEEINLDNLKRVANACLAKGIKLFFPSTTSIYGSRNSRIDETSTKIKPQSPHAKSKLACERYLKKLGAKGLEYVICRFGTIYGFSPGMRFDTAVNKFIWQALTSEPLTVWKSAWKQKRPYLYLGDCTRAINFIIERDLFNGEIYNVASSSYTVEEVIKEIRLFVPKLEVSFVDSLLMNNLSYEIDDNKLRKLGFRPLGTLKTGIEETVDQLKGIV